MGIHLAFPFVRRVAMLAVLAVVGTLVLPAGTRAAKDDTTLISRASGVAGAAADSLSSASAISEDGRYVAFESGAQNFDDATFDGTTNVFVRDLQTNTTTLASRATGADGEAGFGHSLSPSLSDDGRFVAFSSAADNLVPGATSDGLETQIFVRDMVANTTRVVDRAGVVPEGHPDLDLAFPSISGDGRFVAFEGNTIRQLAPPIEVMDIFVADLQTDTVKIASRASGANGARGDLDSREPSISSDGRFVTFRSFATNIDADSDDEQIVEDIFLRDLQTDTTTLVSRATGAAGAASDGRSFGAAISADGGHVAFGSFGTNLDADSDDSVSDIFVRDLQSNTTTLVSRAGGVAGEVANQSSGQVGFDSAISSDGRFIAFESNASNLAPGPGAVFVRDVVANTTALVSRASGPNGVAADGGFEPSISGDGRFVSFTYQDFQNRLSPDSNPETSNVFLRDALGPPPGLVVNDALVKEGSGRRPNVLEFQIALDVPSVRDVTVNVSTQDGTALASEDYVPLVESQVLILAGELSRTFAVTLIGDGKKEPDETFTVLLSDSSHSTIADGSGQGTIENDDKKKKRR